MLDLYKNIRKLRLELSMSQSELAKRTGYTDRSSIAKIEKGEVDLTESKIKAFANALGVKPSFLMGWDDPAAAQEHNAECSSDLRYDETILLQNYNKLNSSGKSAAQDRVEELTMLPKYTGSDEDVGEKPSLSHSAAG